MNKDKPKIAIIGYGSMGKEVERIANEQEITVSEIFDIDNLPDPDGKYKFDVAIDFTQPTSVINNIELVASLGKNMVVGTTGWLEDINQAEVIIKKAGTGLVYGTNFSIGMQMFIRITKLAASLTNSLEDYDIMLHELHHKHKKDSPSGSALTLANTIIKEIKRKKVINDEISKGLIDPRQLHVTSTRGGEITGTHTVYIDSEADSIELTHRAKNRTGFASGAVESAKWIYKRKGFYDFNVVFDKIIK
jgi:4-hydroxy-tetrahydrodipicolinate reductase